MTNVSRNSLDLIENAGKSLKGKFWKAFLATLILVAPIMVCVFSFYLIPVAILLFGVVQTGYIRYMRDLLDGKQPSLKVIFGEFTNPGLEILLGTLLIAMFVVGGILLIFPGLVLVGFYSMSLYFAEKKKSLTPFEAMKQSRTHMKANITNMFSYKVLFWLGYVLLVILAVAVAFISVNLWAEYKFLSILVFLLDFIFTTLVWTLISTYYNAATELFFRELTAHDNEAKEVVEAKVEPVQEIAEEVEEKPVKKQTSAKTPAKKTATTKTTTKSTAAKSSKATASSVASKAPATKKATSSKTTKTATKTAPKKTTATKTTTKTTK